MQPSSSLSGATGGGGTISNAQMDAVRSSIKDHLEKQKFFDSLKTAVAKDPKLHKLDRNQIIEKLRSEGVLNEIINTLPIRKTAATTLAGQTAPITASGSLNSMTATKKRQPAVSSQQLDPNKRYLSVTVVKGCAFADYVNLRTDEHMSVSVSFLKNRYHTKMVQCCTDPVFEDTFLYEFEGDDPKIKFDASMLLKLAQPLHITVLKHRNGQKPVVLGTKSVDWRPLLYCNQVELNVEVLPVSLTQKGSLGVLILHLDLAPTLGQSEILTEEHVDKQLTLERKFEGESVQRFLDYANDWWADYKNIRAQHKTRLVKIFAETDDRENSVFKPVCSLIQPMIADRLLDSPLHAARFVSLVPFERLESPGAERVEVWHAMQSFLSRGCGDSEDHAVLLCNLLLGFGLEAYVCIGTNSEGSHAWVMSRHPPQNGKQKVDFWESLTGQKFDSQDPRVHRFYRTIGCVFNHQAFFANVQQDDRVVCCNFEFEDEYMWKGMAPSQIKTLSPSTGIGYLMPSAKINIGDEEKLVEQLLKEKIGAVRRNEHQMSTSWDSQMSYLLSTALANYEFERIGGGSFATEEFQHGIKNYVPEGHTFKAFPIQFTHYETDRMMTHMMKNQTGAEVMLARGDQVRHAIRVKIIQYPENVAVVWVMIAVRHRAMK